MDTAEHQDVKRQHLLSRFSTQYSRFPVFWLTGKTIQTELIIVSLCHVAEKWECPSCRELEKLMESKSKWFLVLTRDSANFSLRFRSVSFFGWLQRVKSYSKVCRKLFSVSRVSSAFPKNSYRSRGLSRWPRHSLQNTQAGPKPWGKARNFGLAWLRLIGPGLALAHGGKPGRAHHYCLPTIPQIVARLHVLRATHPTPLRRVYVLSNGWGWSLAALERALRVDEWVEPIVSSAQVEACLDGEQRWVGMAVDMAVVEKAEVFWGNGCFSSLSLAIHRLDHLPNYSCVTPTVSQV